MNSRTLKSITNSQKEIKYILFFGAFLIMASCIPELPIKDILRFIGISLVTGSAFLIVGYRKLKASLIQNLDLLQKIDNLGSYSVPFTGKSWIDRAKLGKDDISFLIGYYLESLGWLILFLTVLVAIKLF